MTDALGGLGATVERIAHEPEGDRPRLGDLVVGRLDGDGPRLLLIGHMDTVFDPGTAAAAAVSVRWRKRATGPA